MTALYLRVEFYYELRSESFLLVHSTKAVVGPEKPGFCKSSAPIVDQSSRVAGQ